MAVHWTIHGVDVAVAGAGCCVGTDVFVGTGVFVAGAGGAWVAGIAVGGTGVADGVALAGGVLTTAVERPEGDALGDAAGAFASAEADGEGAGDSSSPPWSALHPPRTKLPMTNMRRMILFMITSTSPERPPRLPK